MSHYSSSFSVDSVKDEDGNKVTYRKVGTEGGINEEADINNKIVSKD